MIEEEHSEKPGDDEVSAAQRRRKRHRWCLEVYQEENGKPEATCKRLGRAPVTDRKQEEERSGSQGWWECPAQGRLMAVFCLSRQRA